MPRRLAFAITAAFVLLCLLSIPAVLATNLLTETTAHITRNPDGSSTGVYLRADLKILVRHRGYGPDLDTDTVFDARYYLPVLVLPPILWFFTHRPSSRAPGPRGGRRLALWCAACPLVVNVAVLYLRRDDGTPLCFAAWFVVAGIVYGLTQLDRIPSRTARRIRQGLCPNCGYDLRATPRRCPECGFRI